MGYDFKHFGKEPKVRAWTERKIEPKVMSNQKVNLRNIRREREKR